MIYERDIREQIAAVLKRDVSLSAFERWLNAESFGMFSDKSAEEAIRLVASVNLLIGELHEDVIDDVVFRDELSALLNNIVVASVPLDQPSWSGSFSANRNHQWVLVSRPLAA